MGREGAIERRAARVVLVDPGDRILLLEGHDPTGPDAGWYWHTPGGGCVPGETWEQCAVREVFEETGLRLEAGLLGPVRRRETVEFPFEREWFRQQQVFFVLVVDPFEVVTTGWDAAELRSHRGVRWWPLAELDTTRESIFPADLAALVRTVLIERR